jgi:hypothetical protein
VIPSSVIAWEGASLFTGERIQVVLTGLRTPSINEKTGPMAQASIVVAGENPSLLLGTERERAVCGDCPLRGRGHRRPCYVAWHAWLLGQHLPKFPRVRLAEAAAALEGKSVRVGAYGDPAAVPAYVWRRLLAHAGAWTGYTHAWRSCDPELRFYFMASAETAIAATRAQLAGWRTFRVRPPGGELLDGEVLCPNESRGVTCDDCRLCAGRARPAKSIAITVHGAGAAEFLRRFPATAEEAA